MPLGEGRPPARRSPRTVLERGMARLVAIAGIVGIGVGIGALLADHKVQGWIIGLVVAIVSLVLAVLLRRS